MVGLAHPRGPGDTGHIFMPDPSCSMTEQNNIPRKASWKHPVHSRGVRSQGFDQSHVNGILTDSKIRKYILQGRYGETARKRLEQSIKNKTKRKPTMKQKLEALLDEVGL